MMTAVLESEISVYIFCHIYGNLSIWCNNRTLMRLLGVFLAGHKRPAFALLGKLENVPAVFVRFMVS